MTAVIGSETKGCIYVVATPIGNLKDFSQRAVETLKQVTRIACEDTRHTGKLLAHFGISTPTVSYHDHNEEGRTKQLLGWLSQGESLALVSDAGTPVVSDPGYRLIRAARQADLAVLPIPGPSAALAALSVSGLPSDRFLFLGFPPKKRAARKQALETIRPLSATLIWYLPPHRLAEQLLDIRTALGDREALLARELTKLHEETMWGRLSEIEVRIPPKAALRGELTLVVAGADRGTENPPGIDVDAYLEGLITHRGLSRSAATSQAARELHLPKRDLYRRSVTSSRPPIKSQDGT